AVAEAEGVAELVSDDLGERRARDSGRRRHAVLNRQPRFADVVRGVGDGAVRRVGVERPGPGVRPGDAVEAADADDAGAVERAADLLEGIVEEDLVDAVGLAERLRRAALDAGVVVADQRGAVAGPRRHGRLDLVDAAAAVAGLRAGAIPLH